MKKVLILGLMMLSIITSQGQVSEFFNYQAVVRNSAGELVVDQEVSIRLSILEGLETNSVIYTETHKVTSNTYGVINLKVGNGSSTQDFGEIDWASDSKFIQVEIDINGGEDYKYIGTSELLSVPYALYANQVLNKDDADADSTNEIQDLSLDNNILMITNNASATPISLAAYQGTNTDNQVLDLNGTDLSISDGNEIDVSSLVNDADSDITNEIQVLSISNDTIFLTDGGFVKLPLDQIEYSDSSNVSNFSHTANSSDYADSSRVANVSHLSYNSEYSDSSRISKISHEAYSSNYADSTRVSKQSYESYSSDYADSARIASSAINSDTAIVAMRLGSNKVYSTDTDTLFVVKDNLGRPVFAVFPDGAKVIVDQYSKGNVGGFAVSGRNPGKASDVSIFRVTPDSTRVYVNNAAKGNVGGFAVSGRNPGKGGVEDILIVNSDSTRVYIDEYSKGNVGGFAVSGRNPGKSGVSDYFNVSGASSAGLDMVKPSEPRMLWYPKSEAFLVGRVLIEDADSVGLNSIATGFESKAIGNYSQALGYKSIARNSYSTAIGKDAIANGESSYAFGDRALTKSSADNSYAIGTNATAQGSNSYAFGNGTIADGAGSFAFGAGGRDSSGVALSTYTIAGGDNSFAMGLGAVAYGLNSFSIGTGTYVASTGENAMAIGFENIASGKYAMALGYKNRSTGLSSMTWGGVRSGTVDYTNIASGRASTAWGFETSATGSQSTTWGQNTEATGTNSTAFGLYTDATGYVSTAWGRSSKAQEYQSTAWAGGTVRASMATAAGGSLVATAYQSFVIGVNNDTVYTDHNPYYTTGRTRSNMEWRDADPLFVIGNGSPSYIVGRRNAFTVLKDGTTIVGWDISSDNTVLNPDTRFNASVKTPRDNGYLFYVHGEAGGAGSWNQTSDIRLKKNVKTIDSALDKVMKLRGVAFDWKDPKRKGRNLGFIAQEAKEVIPEVVNGSEETQFSMEYAPITAVLVEAIKEQQTKIDSLEQQNKDLLERLKKLEELILKK